MTDLLSFYLLVAPGGTSTSWSLLWGVNPTVQPISFYFFPRGKGMGFTGV